jgi:hypothetical protein
MRLIIPFLLAALPLSAEPNPDAPDLSLREIPGLHDFASQRAQTESKLSDLTTDPGRYIVEKTYLGNPAALKKFLKNRSAVDSFLSAKLTVFIAGHGWAVKKLAGQDVVKAVIASPAMRDRRLVSDLFLKSAIPLRLGRASGVREALADRAFVEKLCSPELRAWLTANPAAQATLKAQSPLVAEVLGGPPHSAQ